ncbi:hypothetical protein NSTCB13_02342 [Nostoc sp. DSM 114160]
MSESSGELTAFSRRQPLNRRQQPQKVQKVVKKRVKANSQQQTTNGQEGSLTRPKNQISTSPISGATRRVKSGLVMPTAVKPIPSVKGKIPPFRPGAVMVKTVRMEKPKTGRRSSRKTQLKPMAKTVLYVLRLLIVGVGMGAIVGTVLSVLDPQPIASAQIRRRNLIIMLVMWRDRSHNLPKLPQPQLRVYTYLKKLPL